ncbi:GNAT family N-acetyltransferase [Candidatus Bipolaricaulota bacterium]|nr:GNAT family N-acetyltransferase [Candidatus Bipolaricaulota bacterium]
MVNYKKIPEEDREKFQEMLHYAFSPHKKEVDYDDEDFWLRIGNPRGIYDGEDLLAISSIHSLETLVREDWLPMGGISAVATSPENRHKGYIKTMLTELLVELRDQEVVLSSLWPFSYPFYDKLGWRCCDRYTTYEFDPEVLEFTAKDPRGSFRQVSEEGYEDIAPAYHKFIRKFNLPLNRSSKWWKHQKLSQWNRTVYCYLWEQNNDVKGYVLYSVEKSSKDEWKKKLKVEELIYQTEEAFYQLLRFLYNHGSQMNRIILPSPLPNKLSLLDLVNDPRDVEAREKPGIMVRCVDVETALEYLPFQEGLKGKLVMSVKDPLLKENDGSYSLNFNGDSPPAINKFKQKASKPDLSLDIGSFTQLYAGYLSPTEALMADNITLDSEAKLPLLERIFPKSRTFFKDGF